MEPKPKAWRRIIANKSDTESDDETDPMVINVSHCQNVTDHILSEAKEPLKKAWRRIIANKDSEEDAESDNAPACKKAKLSVEIFTKLSSKREYWERSDGSQSSSPAAKRLKINYGDREIPLEELLDLKEDLLTHDEKLLFVEQMARGRWIILINNTSLVPTGSMLKALITLVGKIIARCVHEGRVVQRITRSRKDQAGIKNRKIIQVGVWACGMIMMNVVFLDTTSILFTEALLTVVHFGESLLEAIRLLIGQRSCQQNGWESDVAPMVRCLISVALCLYRVLLKKKHCMEEFIDLVLNIALLPTLGENMAETETGCLDLLRSVLKNQPVPKEVYISKLYARMSEDCFWADEFCVAVERGGDGDGDGGSRVSKWTLALLVVLQSSAELVVEDFTQSDKKALALLRGPTEDDDDQSSRKVQVVDSADYCLAHFCQQLRGTLLGGEIPKNWAKLVRDLVALMAEPFWPAAEHALFTFCQHAVESLRICNLPRGAVEFLTDFLADIFTGLDRSLSPLGKPTGTDIGNADGESLHWSLPALPIESKDELVFLQGALFALLARRRPVTPSLQDALLFYMSVWRACAGTSPREWKEMCSKTDLDKAEWFLCPWHTKAAVRRILSLRRTSSFQNLFDEVLRVGLSDKGPTWKCVLRLLLGLCQSNAGLFVDSPRVRDIVLTQRPRDPVQVRRLTLHCLLQYLLHRPRQLFDYHKVLNFYILDKDAMTIRREAVKGLAMIVLKFHDNPVILRKCVLLLKTVHGYLYWFPRLVRLNLALSLSRATVVSDRVLLLDDRVTAYQYVKYADTERGF